MPELTEEECKKKVIEFVEWLEEEPNAKLNSDPRISAEIREEVYHSAFIGCLSGWYPAIDRQSKMMEFRHKLINELLKNRGWTVGNIAYNLNAPNSLGDIKNDGWIDVSKKQPISNSDDLKLKDVIRYVSFDGVEFDYKNATININAKKYDPAKPEPCLFTNIDLTELIQMGELQGGPSLSLAPVDPNKPYHPFQRVTFAPSYMYGSRLMRCMFLCDYFLKWIVMGSEVQFKPNESKGDLFEMRSLKENFLADLPDDIKDLLQEFQNLWVSSEAHRVWFEPERINMYDISDFDESGDKEIYRFGNARMLMKHQKRTFNADGKLIDDINGKEGLPFYLLSQKEYKNLSRMPPKAFIVIPQDSEAEYVYKCVFWQAEKNSSDSNEIAVLEISKDDELASLLYQLHFFDKSERGEILTDSIKSTCVEDDDKADLRAQAIEVVYRVLKIACQRTNQDHGFSAAFCFAWGITDSYDVLAKHVHEFARFKELTKIVSCVKLMAARQRELKQKAQEVESKKSWIKWATTSSEQLKRSEAFDKALKNIKFRVLKDDDFSTDEQELIKGSCHWVPAIMNSSEIGEIKPFHIYGGATSEREGKRIILTKNQIQGHAAEVYHYDRVLKDSGAYVFPQVSIWTPSQKPGEGHGNKLSVCRDAISLQDIHFIL